METNLSETVFFVKGEGRYHIRWFTPGYEIDLCGHATLASAFIIKNFLDPNASDIGFTTQKAGSLNVYINKDRYTLDFPARMPQPCSPPENLLRSLGLTTAVEILRSRDYFVVVEDEAAVLACKPDYSIMQDLDTIGVIVTGKGSSAEVVSRCFYPGAGIPEDPVTGSAHCNIVPYWTKKLGKLKLVCKQASSRTGILECELRGDRVLMSGSCVLFSEGKLHI
jgi:PhzF family phenazine biosynthesis protein